MATLIQPSLEEQKKAFEAARQETKDGAPPDTCPLLGVGTMLGFRQLTPAERLQTGQDAAPALASVFLPCIQEKCAFWTGPAPGKESSIVAPGGCSIKQGFVAMAAKTMPMMRPMTLTKE